MAVDNKYKYSDITEKIIGCAFRVHNTLGFGFTENIYQRALQVEFEKEKIHFFREYEIPIMYEKVEVGFRRVDFLVEDKIVVELKAVAEITNRELVQTLNYLKAFRKEIALVINFGEESLKFKRLINNI
jgi:GxxExxY protein